MVIPVLGDYIVSIVDKWIISTGDYIGLGLFYLMYTVNCAWIFIGNVFKIIAYSIVMFFGPYEPVVLYSRNGDKILVLSRIQHDIQECTIFGTFQYHKSIRRLCLNQDGSISGLILTEKGNSNNFILHWLPLMNKQKRLWMILCGARSFEYTLRDLFGIKEERY
jgi:hypothetical protein